jgi:hypothetical protein
MGVLALAAVSAFAGTCIVTNTRLTTINNKEVFAAQFKNETGANFLDHQFLVAFTDASNNLVETRSVEGCLRSLQNNQSNYFSVTSTNDASVITAALSRLALDGTLKAGATADGHIVISNLRIRRLGPEVRVSGTIKNEDGDRLHNPKACAVVKDETGKILIVAKTSNLNDLDQNGTVDFTINVTALDSADDVATVSVYVDGLEGGDNGTPVDPAANENNGVTVCTSAPNTPTFTPSPTVTATPTGTPPNTNTPTSTATPCF